MRTGRQELRAQIIANSCEIDEKIILKAGALLQEVVRRTLGVTLYDEQLLAGLALSRGAVAEMQTGEGKTLAAVLPAYLNVLASKKVHIATPNSYLACRDFAFLQPLYAALEISSKLLPEGPDLAEKRVAYAADVTYGTGYEFGFDYLREQLACLGRRRQELGQRRREIWRGLATEELILVDRSQVFAIIDEIDSVLIDEACLPLLISSHVDAESVDAKTYLAGATRPRLWFRIVTMSSSSECEP